MCILPLKQRNNNRDILARFVLSATFGHPIIGRCHSKSRSICRLFPQNEVKVFGFSLSPPASARNPNASEWRSYEWNALANAFHSFASFGFRQGLPFLPSKFHKVFPRFQFYLSLLVLSFSLQILSFFFLPSFWRFYFTISAKNLSVPKNISVSSFPFPRHCHFFPNCSLQALSLPICFIRHF